MTHTWTVQFVTLVTLAAAPALAQGVAERERELNERLEWETFVTEVENQLINTRSQLTSATARLRDQDPQGALADLEEGEAMLGDLMLLAKDFTQYNPPGKTMGHVASRRVEVRALKREIFYLRTRAHALAGDLEPAREACEAGLALVAEPEDGVRFRLLASDLQIYAGQLAEALGALRALRDEFPHDAEVRFRLGRAHDASGETDEALACFDWVIQRAPQSAIPHLARGATLHRVGRTEEALTSFEYAVDIQDDLFEGYLWLGIAKTALGRYGEAQEDLTEAIDINPASPLGYYRRAELFFSNPAGNVANAIKDAEVAISRQANFLPAYVLLGRALERALDYDRAEAQYQEVLRADRLDPALRFEVTLALGELSLVRANRWLCLLAGDEGQRSQRLKKAEEACQAGIRARPEDIRPRVLAARVLLDQGKAPAAAKQLRRAARMLAEQVAAPARTADVRWGEVHALLGVALLEAGDLEGAKEALGLAGSDARVGSIVQAARSRIALAQGSAPHAQQQTQASLDQLAHDSAARFREEAYRQASLARRSGKPEFALSAGRAFARALLLQPLDGAAWLEWARLSGERSRLAAARGLAQEATRRLPALAAGHEALGFFLLEEGQGAPADPAAAVQAFDRAIGVAESGREAAHAHYGRAQALTQRAGGPTEDARVDLEAAARAAQDQRDPQGFARAQLWLASLAELEASQGNDEAAATYQRRADAIRDQALALSVEALEAGRALRDRLNYSAAIQKFDQALELDPTNAAAFYDRGTCYLKIGNFVPGILDFARALELNPEIGDQVYNKVYQISYVVDLERVINELDKIVGDHPNVWYVVFLRGFFYVAKIEQKSTVEQDVAAGIADFDRTLELNPEHVTALLYRGFLHSKQAQLTPSDRDRSYERAEADFARALELHPTSSTGYYLRALMGSIRSAEAGLPETEATARRTRAIDALRQAIANGWKGYERFRNEPGFDPLRHEPALKELMR